MHTRIRTFDNNNWKKNYQYYFKVSRGHSAPAQDSHQRRLLLYTAVAQFVTAVQFKKRFDLRISSVHNYRQFLSHYDRFIERILTAIFQLFVHILSFHQVHLGLARRHLIAAKEGFSYSRHAHVNIWYGNPRGC